MSQPLQIFMEYRINGDKVIEYEAHMQESLLKKIEEYEATEIQWFEAADQEHLYVEMFKVPTMAHYESIKEKRRDADHPVFGRLNEFVDGGMKKVHCWAFVKKT